MKIADPILAAGAHYKKLPGPYILPIFFENFFNLSIRSEGFVYKTVWHRLSPMPSQGLMKISERSNTRSAFNTKFTKNAQFSLSTKQSSTCGIQIHVPWKKSLSDQQFRVPKHNMTLPQQNKHLHSSLYVRNERSESV